MTEAPDQPWQASVDAATPAVILKLASDRLGHGPLGIARSLGRLGIAVHLVTPDARSPAGYSHYVGRSWVLPDPGDDDAVLETLRLIARVAGDQPVLFAPDDLAAMFVDRRLDDLKALFRLPDQPPGLPAELSNKRALHERCIALGIPSPEGRVPRSIDEAREYATALGYPVVIKAADPRSLGGVDGPASVTIARNPGQLEK